MKMLCGEKILNFCFHYMQKPIDIVNKYLINFLFNTFMKKTTNVCGKNNAETRSARVTLNDESEKPRPCLVVMLSFASQYFLVSSASAKAGMALNVLCARRTAGRARARRYVHSCISARLQHYYYYCDTVLVSHNIVVN